MICNFRQASKYRTSNTRYQTPSPKHQPMRRKLERFEEIKPRVNVFDLENEGYEKIKGKWHINYFNNENDTSIILH